MDANFSVPSKEVIIGVGIVAAAAVAAGGAAGSAYLEGKAKKDAIATMRNAWQKLQSIDIKSYRKQAGNIARENYLERFKLFREGDPELAQVRDVAIQNALDVLKDTSGNQAKAQQVADRLAAGALDMESDARAKQLESSLLQRAQENLDRGAELPPEFQSELVRAGLEQGGTAGFTADRKGPLAQLLGKKIGSEAIALERQRAADALNLGQGAQALRTNRLNILAGIAPALQNMEAGKFNLSFGATQLANQGMPEDVGLTGREVLNLRETNRALENQKILAEGQLKAGKHIVSGETAKAYLGAGTSFLTNLLGGVGGGAGGGNSGGGGMLAGLLGGGGGSQSGGGLNISTLLTQLGYGGRTFGPGEQTYVPYQGNGGLAYRLGS